MPLTPTAARLPPTPSDHPDLGEVLCDFGIALRKRFERTRALESLDEAVHACRRAAGTVPQGHPRRGRYSHSLGGALLLLFERTAEPRFLDEAIAVGRDALAGTPDNHADIGLYLTGLCVTLQRRFTLQDDLADITEAVELGRRAVDLCPVDHPGRGALLLNLGTALGAVPTAPGADTSLHQHDQQERCSTSSALLGVVHGWVFVCDLLVRVTPEEMAQARPVIEDIAARMFDGFVRREQRTIHLTGWAAGLVDPDALAIDDTGFPKNGEDSPGAARMYCGALGKTGTVRAG